MTTKYKELIAIANHLAGEDVSGEHPRTVAGAIDAITDALAGQDVDGGQTIASAIAALAPYVDGGGGGEDVTVYVFFNTSTVTLEIDGEPVTLVDSTDVPNAKELTAPIGTLVSCTTTGNEPSVSIYPSLQEIIDDGDPVTYYIVYEGAELLVPVLPLTTIAF